ncbi:DUF998 domain-containing protein [Actinoplanes sp. DH11]|uniref:DUF998 domain-containing protein n=1 Tax=Actinoplanes sp. DH11 TaxID=2857011 RepID=UPI001E2D89B8|nr:DUF998 domain-containing protein [Actinoplanes sp. DH11]
MKVLVFAGLGVVCVVASLMLYGVLHLVPPSAELDWARRTISQYALMPNGWLFDTATLLLAGGSAAIVVALLRAGLLTRGALAGLVLWVVGLVGVVWFEKHNWSVGPSVGGDIHRVASVVAFLSLPLGTLLAAAPRMREPGARLVAAAAAVALLCFTPILWAVTSEPWTGVRWWRAIPLGGVERLLGLAEVITVLLLAWWAARTARRTGAGHRVRRWAVIDRDSAGDDVPPAGGDRPARWVARDGQTGRSWRIRGGPRLPASWFWCGRPGRRRSRSRSTP